METSRSFNTDVVPSGLSYTQEGVTHAKRGLKLLSEMDTLLHQVSCVMNSLREIAESAKRRRELLDVCVRSNLLEMPDGQFTQMTNDTDRCRMLEIMFEADKEFSDAKLLFHLGFTKTLNGLRFVSEQHTVPDLNPFGTVN
jgi:hypothetical protein